MASCGGGQIPSGETGVARTVAQSEARPAGMQASEAGELDSNRTSRASPAELLGIDRLDRPAMDTGSESTQPERNPHSSPQMQDALNRFCPQEVVRWTSPEGRGRCAARAPAGIAPVRSERLDNQHPDSLGSILLECHRAEDGRAYWQPARLSTPTCRLLSEPPIEDPLETARRNNCMACHQANGTYAIGAPSFQQIADRYRANPLPPGELESRIIRGSSGYWGNVPMPPNPQANAYNLSIILPWILNR